VQENIHGKNGITYDNKYITLYNDKEMGQAS